MTKDDKRNQEAHHIKASAQTSSCTDKCVYIYIYQEFWKVVDRGRDCMHMAN